MSDKKNLFEKIQLVSNEVRNIAKDMTVGTGNYSYKAVSDLDVTLAVKDAESKYRLTSIPIKQELVNSEIVRTLKKDNVEGLTYVDTIKMTIRIVDLDDTDKYLDVESFGKGIDSGDKGFGKASTYARKYALLNAYKIATGEDPDADKSESTTVKKTVSEKRKTVTDYLNLNVETLVKVCEHFSVAEITDLSDVQVETLYGTYKKRGVI
jgi:hypothetical protein